MTKSADYLTTETGKILRDIEQSDSTYVAFVKTTYRSNRNIAKLHMRPK